MSAGARGIVLGSNGDELIVKATDADVAKFGKGNAVHVAPLNVELGVPWWETDGRLYDAQGRAVCWIRNVQLNAPQQFDVTTFTNYGEQTYVQGLRSYRIEAEGPVY